MSTNAYPLCFIASFIISFAPCISPVNALPTNVAPKLIAVAIGLNGVLTTPFTCKLVFCPTVLVGDP